MYIYRVLTLVKYRWEATYSRWITIYSIYLTSSRYITIYSFMAIINQMVIQFYNSSLIYGLEGRFVFFLAPPSRDFWSNFLVLVWKGQVKGKPFICCYWAGARSKLYIYIQLLHYTWMAMVILSTIYLGVLIVDGLLLVTRNSYMYLLWTQNSLLGTMEHL